MSRLARWVADRPIITRLVISVAAAMTAVLVASGAFVFWRVEFALNRQLDQDLRAYEQVVQTATHEGAMPPSDTPGQTYQAYTPAGRVIEGDAPSRLVDPTTVVAAARGQPQRVDVGHLFPPAEHPYRALVTRVDSPAGPVVVAAAISRSKHDEALRELLVQLALAGGMTLVAASYVGYRTARAALNPVERYRRAAESADPRSSPQLPVPTRRDDELTRLGHTFNTLLLRIAEASQRQRQTLADASHELRAPLTVMKTELEWVQLRPRTPEETRACLTSLTGQVERLIELSNLLLDLEEVRASGTPADDVHLGPLVDRVVGLHQADAASQGRRIDCATQPCPPVQGSARWLELALSNLVSNALRHGAGTVTVGLTLSSPSGVRLSVTDQGPGFPPDFIDQAFDRFTRAEASRTTPGTGLGLALVQAVADAHGATTHIDGSTVTLDLHQAGCHCAWNGSA
jgi:signal transduction histidine kinase